MQHAILSRLPPFLVEAKRHTYAGLDDDATGAAPLLPGSRQLEHHAGDLHYRDIYFGMASFAGLETVAAGERVIWCMSYSGGASHSVTEHHAVLEIYAFLRKVLLAIPEQWPYRGPPLFEDGRLRHRNDIVGDISQFHGVEDIDRAGAPLYALRYSGGVVR